MTTRMPGFPVGCAILPQVRRSLVAVRVAGEIPRHYIMNDAQALQTLR